MIIKELNIKAFGSIKNKKIELSDGMNVIYGPNESGKSTIEGFIRIFLYGMASARKSSKENERKRFIPWHESKAQGEMHVDYNGQDIIISRSFGAVKKEDYLELINGLTGEKVKKTAMEPGRQFLDLSKESFVKTMLIKQLGAEIGRDKEEEIMQKLTNLEQAGEDGVSYHEAVAVLENYKKLYVGMRKNGKLDELRNKAVDLASEYKEAVKRNEDGIDDEIRLKNLKDERDSVIKDIHALELYKKHMKRMNLKKEYDEISKYLKRSRDLSETKENYDKDLGDGIMDESLDAVLTGYKEYKGACESEEEYKKRYDEVNGQYSALKDEFKSMESFQGLDEDADIKIMKLMEEKKENSIKLQHMAKTKENLDGIENELESVRIKIKKYGINDEDKEDIDELLKEYENSLKEIKYFLSTYSIDEKLLSQKDNMKKRENIGRVLLLAGSVMLFAFMYFLIMGRAAEMPAIISLLCGGAFIGCWAKNRSEVSVYMAKLASEEKNSQMLDNLKGAINDIEGRLSVYYEGSGAESYEQFLSAIKNYDILKDREEKLRYMANERLLDLNAYEGGNLEDNMARINKMINFLLNHTGSESPEDFLKNHKIYKEKFYQLENLEHEVRNIEKYYKGAMVKRDEIESSLKKLLEKIQRDYIPMDRVEEEISLLKKKLQDKKEVEAELKRVEDSYKLLLKDRHLEDIKDELQDLFSSESSLSFEREEDVDNCIRSNNEKLRNVEKSIKDVENSIDNRFKGVREPWVIEEELNSVKEGISYGEEEVAVIDIALDNLRECFKELQKNFGPKLNSIVGRIYGELTGGRYNEAKVGENYDLLLRDEKEDSLVEVNYLSNGAFDQAYFALRMALIEMIFKDTKVPIILDDTFVQYDDRRTENALDLLYRHSRDKQVILLTCQSREKEYFKEFKDVNLINMEEI